MKIILNPRGSQGGSVLVVGLIITSILGVMLASYLLMTRGQNVSVVRSQTWNTAFVLTEAGVEDALAMMNKYSGDYEALYNWTNPASLTADNWTTVSPNVFYAQRSIGANSYEVYITNIHTRPVIRSIGTVAWNHTYASTPQGFLATVGAANPSTPTYLDRKVEVRTRIDPLFNFALAALNVIELNGNNVASDSFDSSNTNYSTLGQYVPDKNKDGGDVVSNDTIQDALNIGNAQIKGQVKTGPKGTVTLGPDGSVGDEAWVEGGNTGIQDGHFADDMNVIWDPVIMPTNVTWLPASGSFGQVFLNYPINGKMYGYAFLAGGEYFISEFTLQKGLYVAPDQHVKLWIQGHVKIGGTDEIYIGANASLKIYMSGPTFELTGNGVVNEGGYAANFIYYGLPSNRSITFGGNADFTGCIYAPNADFYLGGGGSGTVDFVGSSITKTVTLKGHFHFHYDEALRNTGPGRGFIPTNWKET